MKIHSGNMLDSILEGLFDIDYIHHEDIPNIDLYMDQVTTFMETQLSSTRRYAEDKILTKTMINNYAKNNLLPPPTKKKYSKEHMLVLIFIYYFKSILSIKYIESLLKPITEKYFHTDNPLSLTDIYDEICKMEAIQVEPFCEEVKQIYDMADKMFTDVPEDEHEDLKFFSFICGLSFDVYLKKFLIEKMIDEKIRKDEQKKEK